MQLFMLRNSAGKPSSSATFAWVSFIFVLVALTFGLISDLTIGTFNIKFKMLDAGVIFALLSPCFSLYGVRRWTDSKIVNDNDILSKSGKHDL